MAELNFRRSGNLHGEVTTFVGRARLLGSIKRHLAESRLVTVTGIGGVGKSRTVLRLAHEVRSQYPDGVWFADLARVQDDGLIKQAIASALGIADRSSRAESESLSEWVGERDMLLIIDTCEHVVRGCAELMEELLAAAPNLKVMTTSRQSLNLPYEHVVPVPPLQVPGEDPVENYFANESVQLFAARASAVLPDFQLNEDNVNSVAELCRRLDGIPLAIELAAVRLRALSVEQILNLLADRFSLLVGASRTALPRHQTLRAAMGWSHELCEPSERLLWARLSVFADDFELDAARFVCSDGRLPAEAITDLVTALVEKSILLIRSNHAGVRYKLIDTLAEYGDEWLDTLGQKEQLRQRHLEYYLNLAQRSQDAWSGPRQIYWFVRMRQEHDNVRVAMEHALKTPGKEILALSLLSSLWFVWVCCGFAREGRLYLERALQANSEVGKERCKALWVLSYVKSAQGDCTGALDAAEKCSTEAVIAGDSKAVILASKMQGTVALLQGDLRKASALLGVAIEFNIDNNELNPGLLPAVVELAIVLIAQGKLDEAESLLLDCLDVCKERGELWLRSSALWVLAQLRLATGRTREALNGVLESLRIKRHFHDTLGMLIALETIARIYKALDQPVVSARLLGALQQNWKTAGLRMLGAPWLADEHHRCVRHCLTALGMERYSREFTEGSTLDLDAALALALGEYEVSEPAGLEIRLADADDDMLAKVEDAVVQFVGAFGFEVPVADRPHSNRYVMRFRTNDPGVTADEQLEEMGRALRDETPPGDEIQAGALDALVAALENVSRAVVTLEQTLLIKVNDKIVTRWLSAAEQAHLDNHRHLFNDPTALMRELDQLASEATLDGPLQVSRDHYGIIVEYLGEAAAKALGAWAATGNYQISVNLPLWAKRGYTQSRLLGLIIKAPSGSDERTSKVVAKICPPGPLSREPGRHRRALDASPRDFRSAHLVNLKPHSPRLGDSGGYVLLQEVAGGSFTNMCQMTELTSPSEIISAFDEVLKGLLREWNRNGADPYSDIDSSEYLRSELRERFAPRGKLHIWAKEKGLLRPEARWIMFEGERTPALLPNPLAMAVGDIVGRQNVQHLRGFTHGDLHMGNILIPRTREGKLLPDQYRLVDLTTFDKSAPLARDPAMLLLSIVAQRIPKNVHTQEELFEQILLGKGQDDLFAPLTCKLHDADGRALIADDFRDDWLNQLPLSLLAAGLLHCTFGNLDEHTRWWFFRLAARCGAEYLRSADSWQPSSESPLVLKLEDMDGFHMSSN
ncbi:tetratricopeptide repeat protein [Nonomuraea sp. NPDC003201]